MKKLIVIVCFIFGVSQTTTAQLDFGLKAGINYNTASITSFKDVESEYFNKTKGKLGYHAGIWLRAKIPAIGLYIRPELVYTALKSEISEVGSTKKGDFNFQKLDVPILLGKKFAKILYVHVGPSLQYVMDGDITYESVKDIKLDGFSVGLQLGGGIELGAFGIDVRWERGFKDVESKLIPKEVGGTTLNFDTRVNQIIFGVSYKF